MAHTPQQNSRVRPPHLPEASPFSSVLARLPDLSPPRTKYTTSFGSLNPLASPPPQTSFGYPRPPSQTPGGASNEGTKSAAFDLLGGGTPMKSIPSEQQLGSPRFELQSPRFPLFQPSPKKPLDSLRSPPSVRPGESITAPIRSFSSPFGSLLDGSSRSGPLAIDGVGGAGPSPPPRGSAAGVRQQPRFSALFVPAGSALNAALDACDILPPAPGLDPAYLSPLRPASAAGGPRRASSIASGAGASGELPQQGEQQQQQQQRRMSGGGAPSATAAAAGDATGAAEAAHATTSAAPDSSLDDDADVEVAADLAAMMRSRGSTEVDEDEDDEDDGPDEGLGDNEDDEDYTASASFRRPPPRRRPGGGPAGAPPRTGQQLFMPDQRPTRRRMLQFAAGIGGVLAEEEGEGTPLVHSTLPQSPMCQPVRMDVDLLLPIPKLRDPSSTSEDGSGGSPSHRLRTGGYSLNSPAVQAAAHAAVAAALEASAGTGAAYASRRPARAAAAGAAAAAKAAAEAAGTPVQRRASGHLARTTSSGGITLSSGLPPITPGEDGAAPDVFSGPKKCNCKKSKCLKLYCDCFANGGFCGVSCSCVNCANKVENSELVRSQRESIKQRNPNAFVQKIEADPALGGQHRRGCNCRKSHCMKKYCECFQAGVACGEHCKCESCHNTAGHAARRPPGAGASKRARTTAAAAATAPRTRQPSTRLAAGSSALSQQLKQAQAVAAASLHAAMAQASASMAAGSVSLADGGSQEDEQRPVPGHVKQEPGGLAAQPRHMMFPVPLPPGMLQDSRGGAALNLIPIMLQPMGGTSAACQLPPMPQPTAAPALAAFAAAAAGAPQPAAAAGAPSHPTPVGALVGPAGAGTASANNAAMGVSGTFSFYPSTVDGSGSSSGHSTPRAAGVRAAAAAADVAFSLDTPAATGACAAGFSAGAGSILEKLLPAAAAAAAGKGTPAALPGVRATPTKQARKPQRTMTAALM